MAKIDNQDFLLCSSESPLLRSGISLVFQNRKKRFGNGIQQLLLLIAFQIQRCIICLNVLHWDLSDLPSGVLMQAVLLCWEETSTGTYWRRACEPALTAWDGGTQLRYCRTRRSTSRQLSKCFHHPAGEHVHVSNLFIGHHIYEYIAVESKLCYPSWLKNTHARRKKPPWKNAKLGNIKRKQSWK